MPPGKEGLDGWVGGGATGRGRKLSILIFLQLNPRYLLKNAPVCRNVIEYVDFSGVPCHGFYPHFSGLNQMPGLLKHADTRKQDKM